MPNCPKCGAEIDGDAAKCFYCGTRLRDEPKPAPESKPVYVPPAADGSPTKDGIKAWAWAVVGSGGLLAVVVGLANIVGGSVDVGDVALLVVGLPASVIGWRSYGQARRASS